VVVEFPTDDPGSLAVAEAMGFTSWKCGFTRIASTSRSADYLVGRTAKAWSTGPSTDGPVRSRHHRNGRLLDLIISNELIVY